MDPYLEIFGKQIPYYGLLFAFGLVLGGLTALIRAKKRNISKFDVMSAAVFAGIAGVLGAKIFSVVTSLNYIIEYKIPFINIIQNGFVFYGGLIGGFFGLMVYCKIYKEPFADYLDVFAVSVPLGHAVGRVGCFISGCCFGVPYNGIFAVTYENAVEGNTPIGVPLLPIQLIESCCLLAFYVALVIIFYKVKKKEICTFTYVIGYAVIRFILEFFRGDLARGVVLGISTSQIISILLLITVAYILLYKKLLKKYKN